MWEDVLKVIQIPKVDLDNKDIPEYNEDKNCKNKFLYLASCIESDLTDRYGDINSMDYYSGFKEVPEKEFCRWLRFMKDLKNHKNKYESMISTGSNFNSLLIQSVVQDIGDRSFGLHFMVSNRDAIIKFFSPTDVGLEQVWKIHFWATLGMFEELLRIIERCSDGI